MRKELKAKYPTEEVPSTELGLGLSQGCLIIGMMVGFESADGFSHIHL